MSKRRRVQIECSSRKQPAQHCLTLRTSHDNAVKHRDEGLAQICQGVVGTVFFAEKGFGYFAVGPTYGGVEKGRTGACRKWRIDPLCKLQVAPARSLSAAGDAHNVAARAKGLVACPLQREDFDIGIFVPSLMAWGGQKKEKKVDQDELSELRWQELFGFPISNLGCLIEKGDHVERECIECPGPIEDERAQRTTALHKDLVGKINRP